MTALIIALAEWRMARRLPSAFEVASNHIKWLREEHAAIGPEKAAALIGAQADTWTQVVFAYAAAWRKLPERVKRGG
jgi:hypothetical protein